MNSPRTGKRAGKIDMIIADISDTPMKWTALEIQAVYFSGEKMELEFKRLGECDIATNYFPIGTRRPDWRSSSAKRLLPQIQVKLPTLRRWGKKLCISMDRPFFEHLGGPSNALSHDLTDGDIIWLIPELQWHTSGQYRLAEWYWTVLTMEASTKMLLDAKPIAYDTFSSMLESKLENL